MPIAQLTGPTQDSWWNAGARYIRSGATRGTTTSSGVFVIPTGFPRRVIFAMADDQATNLRNTQTGGGPAQTTGTFYWFQYLSEDDTVGPASARFRVRKETLSAGGSRGSTTLASTTTGVTARWFALGY